MITYDEAIRTLKEACCEECVNQGDSPYNCPNDKCELKQAVLLAVECLGVFEKIQKQLDEKIDKAILYGEDSDK